MILWHEGNGRPIIQVGGEETTAGVGFCGYNGV